MTVKDSPQCVRAWFGGFKQDRPVASFTGLFFVEIAANLHVVRLIKELVVRICESGMINWPECMRLREIDIFNPHAGVRLTRVMCESWQV